MGGDSVTQSPASGGFWPAVLGFAAACTTAKTPTGPEMMGPARAPMAAPSVGNSASRWTASTVLMAAASAGRSAMAEPSRAAVRSSAAGGSHSLVIEAPYWATPHVVVDKMLELAKVQPTDIVYDLGCGDARSLVTAAQRYGARGFGDALERTAT